MVTVGLDTQSQKTPVPSGAKLQKQKVTGRIYDQQGEPLVGARVRIKGTNIGSVADINGVYEIEAEPNAVLQFSYIGMEAQEITYKGGNKLDVSLKADNKTELEAVVVTGIFQKPKESFTGAVSTITSEQLKMYKGQNMLQTLRNVDASINQMCIRDSLNSSSFRQAGLLKFANHDRSGANLFPFLRMFSAMPLHRVMLQYLSLIHI